MSLENCFNAKWKNAFNSAVDYLNAAIMSGDITEKQAALKHYNSVLAFSAGNEAEEAEFQPIRLKVTCAAAPGAIPKWGELGIWVVGPDGQKAIACHSIEDNGQCRLDFYCPEPETVFVNDGHISVLVDIPVMQSLEDFVNEHWHQIITKYQFDDGATNFTPASVLSKLCDGQDDYMPHAWPS